MTGIDTAFVGRRLELARLRAALDHAEAGEPNVVLVSGEAGIGKSRLVAHLGAEARERGWLVIGGACLELSGGTMPYLPFVEALRALLAALPPDRVRPIIGPAREELRHLVPELATEPRGREARPAAGAELGEEGHLARMRLFELLLGMAERIAAEWPLAVVVEDLQWGDAASLDLIAFLTRNIRHGRMVLFITVRTDDLGDRHPLLPFLGELERNERVEHVELDRFGREDVVAQLTGLLGRPPETTLVDRVIERTAGNPFFVEELADLADAGGALPAQLRDILVARLGSLSEPAREVVRIASAAGRTIDDALLVRVAAQPDRKTIHALREAVERGILVPADGAGVEGYAFRHPLLREVVATSLLPGERRRLHAAFAHALAETPAAGPGPSAAELAYHWDAAGDAGRALNASIEAGYAAERVYAFREAQGHFERALELWDSVPFADDRVPVDRLAVSERAAAMAALVGDHRRAIKLTRAALASLDETADPERAGLFHSRLRWYLWESGDQESALADALEAVRLVPADPPSALRANVLGHAAGLLLFSGRIEESERLAREALALAQRVGAHEEEALALGVLGWDLVQTGRVEEGLASVREAWLIARRIGQITGLALAYNHLAAILDHAGRVAESLQVAEEGIELAARLGVERTFGAQLEGNAAHALFRLGRWPEADALTRRALERGAAGAIELWLLVVRSRLDVARGRFAEAAREFAALGAIEDEVGARPYLGWLAVAQAEAAVWQADPRSALDRVMAMLDAGELPRADASVASLAALGLRAAADLLETAAGRADGSIEAARPAARRIQDLVRRLRSAELLSPPDLPTAGPIPTSPGHGAEAALIAAEASRLRARPDPGPWRATEAAAQAEGRVYLVAYARFRLAAAFLARRGGRDAVAAALRGADEVATGLGAAPLRDAIEELARRARIPLPTTAAAARTTSRFGLTEREREVLALVAEGRSNREIGQVLFISPKTASVHVSNILGKLGVEGRVEAVTMAHRLGLLEPEPAGAGAPTSRR